MKGLELSKQYPININSTAIRMYKDPNSGSIYRKGHVITPEGIVKVYVKGDTLKLTYVKDRISYELLVGECDSLSNMAISKRASKLVKESLKN